MKLIFYIKIILLFVFNSTIAKDDNPIKFNSDEEKFISECVLKLDSLVLANRASKSTFYNFAVDWRRPVEKNAFKITILSDANVILNNFHTNSLTRNVPVAPYVLFTTRYENESSFNVDQLLNDLEEGFETKSSGQKIGFIEKYNSLKSETTNNTINNNDRSIELTKEILSRSILGNDGIAGTLLHYDFHFKVENGKNKRYINTNLVFDKRLPSFGVSEIYDPTRNQASGSFQWGNVFKSEITNYTNKLNATYSSITQVYKIKAVDALNKRISYNNANINNNNFDPYNINDNKANANNNSFNEENTNFILSTETNGAIPGYSSEDTYKKIKRKLGFYAYETKKELYILHVIIESSDRINFTKNYLDFGRQVFNQSNLNKNNSVLILVFGPPTGLNMPFNEINYAIVHGNAYNPYHLKESFDAAFQSTAALVNDNTKAFITGMNQFEKGVVYLFMDLPKPLITYRYAINKECEVVRIINVQLNSGGILHSRHLEIVSGYNPTPKYIKHDLLPEYIDQYNINAALLKISGESSLNNCHFSLTTSQVMNFAIPPFAKGIEIDYYDLAADYISLAAALLAPPYQIIVGASVATYYYNKGNYFGTLFEVIGVGISVFTHVNVKAFLNGTSFKVIATTTDVLSSGRLVDLSKNFDYNFIHGIRFNYTDDFVDIAIHGEGDNFILLIEKNGFIDEISIGADKLASILKEVIPENKAIRLLSCVDINAAKQLSVTSSRTVYTTGGIVRVHYADGGITTIPNKTGESVDWFKIERDKITKVAAPKGPAENIKNIKGEFLEFSNAKQLQADKALELGCAGCSTLIMQRGTIRGNTLNYLNINNGDPAIANFAKAYTDGGYPPKLETETWTDYFTKFEERHKNFNGFEAHHLNPANLFITSEGFRHYFNFYKGTDILNFNASNDIINSIFVEKKMFNKTINQTRGVHTNHYEYEELLKKFYDQEFNRIKIEKIESGISPEKLNEEIANEMHSLIIETTNALKKIITNECVIQKNEINLLFNNLNDLQLKLKNAK
jgi:hypothetical protein